LEDNDPTGNRSKAGIKAKADARIKVFEIPKRSPDLNVLDYAIWAEIGRRMRALERKMKDTRTETRAQFEKRLDSVAKNLPASFINRSIGDMQNRVRKLHEAKGGLFEEGGRSKRKRRS